MPASHEFHDGVPQLHTLLRLHADGLLLQVEAEAEELGRLGFDLDGVYAEALLGQSTVDLLGPLLRDGDVGGDHREVVHVAEHAARAGSGQGDCTAAVLHDLIGGEAGIVDALHEDLLADGKRPRPAHRQDNEAGRHDAAARQRGRRDAGLHQQPPADARQAEVALEPVRHSHAVEGVLDVALGEADGGSAVDLDVAHGGGRRQPRRRRISKVLVALTGVQDDPQSVVLFLDEEDAEFADRLARGDEP